MMLFCRERDERIFLQATARQPSLMHENRHAAGWQRTASTYLINSTRRQQMLRRF
jgi:hypothetical protein